MELQDSISGSRWVDRRGRVNGGATRLRRSLYFEVQD